MEENKQRAAEWICWAHPREAEAGKGEGAGTCSDSQGVECWDFKPWKGTTLAVWRDKLGLRPASLLVEKLSPELCRSASV